jgi:tetratricopeptide (TPR) repeat protein
VKNGTGKIQHMSHRSNKNKSKRPSSNNKKETSRRSKVERRKRKNDRSFSVSANSNSQKDAIKSQVRQISGQRLLLFRAIAVLVIPALLILLLEVGLRLVGYGYRPEAIIKYEVNDKEVCCDNSRFGWRFFPKNIAREFTPFTFTENKADNACRIFVLGASAAQGVPYPSFSFGRILKVMLREMYPGVNFEVIVVAMAAINSHVVLEAAKDCALYKPDIFVVYLGNNEVVGPYGAGTVFSSFSNKIYLIRAGIALKGMRLGQLLTNMLESIRPEKDRLQVWRGMEMNVQRQVPINDARLQTVYRHFQRNLEDIVRLGHKAGAKIILCTVGSNLKDNPPFSSLHSANLSSTEIEKWEAAYQEGINHEKAEAYGQAVESCMAAAEIDDSYADLQYRLGKYYWAVSDYDKARERYIQARDMDTLRFRADSRINQIIRDVVSHNKTKGLYLVDAVETFEQNSPQRIPGTELFHEHVHLNFHGNYLLAKTVFEQIEKILPNRLDEPTRAGRPFMTEIECAGYLAYTDWDRYKTDDKVLNGFLKKPPFTNQLYHDKRIREMEQNLTDLKLSLTPEVLKEVAAQYRQAIEKDSSDWMLLERYGMLLIEDIGDPRSALEQYRLVAKSLPNSYLGYYNMGTALFKLGDYEGGVIQYKRAIRIKPTDGYAHYILASAYQKKDDIDKAIEHYSEAIRWRPDLVPAYNNLAEIRMRRQEVDKAIELFRRGLRFSPDSAILHCNLGVLLNKLNRREEAIKEIRKASEIDPNSVRIRNILEAVLRGDR